MRAIIVLQLVLLGAAGTVWAEETDVAKDAWTPELAMQYRSIRATAISADGSRIAYVVRSPEMEGEKSEWVSQIWVASADGSDDLQFTRGTKSCTAPAFSPDGRSLAFLSARSHAKKTKDEKSPKTQLWVMGVDGGEARQLTEAKSSISSFAWSPDGGSVAFLMPDPETEEEEKQKKEKRDVILVDQNHKYGHLHIVVVGSGTGQERETRRLTEGDFHVAGLDWAPDGQTIAIARQADPRINTNDKRDLALVSVASGEVTPLVTRPGADDAPRYSPDGAWIAFTSHGGTPQRVGLADVFVVAAQGGEPRALAATPDRSASLLGWSAEGDAVHVLEGHRTRRQVLTLPVDAGEPRPALQGDGVISSVSSSRNGKALAFVHESLVEPPEVYVTPVGQAGMTRLSAVNQDVPRPPMGRTELLSWSSPDGLRVEGLLTYPMEYQEGQTYPLILCIHGGPAGVFSQGFTGMPAIYQHQYFAQNGYAILRPNPRGSSGYGKEFRYANVRDWGYGDYEDVMSGVDEVVKMGLADPAQLFVMGWSYGGYLTSFIVTRTDRFRAASMGAGLPNLVSMVTTTDIPDYLVAHMGGEVWEDYATYEKHSAMYRIGKVTTPTQVVHGAKDLRVPFTQGQEFFVALERRGVPTEMVVYPRTPHGPREPKLLMDVSPRVLKWFERFRAEASSAEKD
jgi:dipeptidyl aminopeptidase/acylaminoacyl peptidase